jgi:anti-sigma regulatory factor (Ser/Thr protein kinase)
MDERRPGPQAQASEQLRIELHRDPQAPAAARAAVRTWCPALAGGPPRRETLLLLVSELVTNAVRHSRGPAEAPIRLTAGIAGEAVRVAVTDAGEGFTARARPQRDPDRMTVGGHGLYVVDQAASRWGVDRVGGTRVWFEV